MTSDVLVLCDNLVHVYGTAGSEVAALRGVEAWVGFDRGRFLRQVIVLDDLAEPRRIVAGVAVMLPGALVDAFRDLREERQVLRAQIEAIVRSAEIEAQVLAELTLGVFALVPVARLLRPQRFHGNRRGAGAARPEQNLLVRDPRIYFIPWRP